MALTLIPGNALAIRVNAHRHGWDGSICDDPTAWRCLAADRFRESDCARGVDSCFHLKMFNLQAPSVMIEENGGDWVFSRDIHAFDDQILLFWTQRFEEPRGVREGSNAEKIVVGAYRVQKIEAEKSGWKTHYRVIPYPGSWMRIHGMRIPMPTQRYAGGPYIKQIDYNHVIRLFQELGDETKRSEPDWFSPEDGKRFEYFKESLLEWLEVAGDEAALREEARARADEKRARAHVGGGSTAFAGLKDLVDVDALPAGPAASPAAKSQPTIKPVAPPAALPKPMARPPRAPLIEPPNDQWIREAHGEEFLRNLQIASLTKTLIILRGNPGVGKSHLALRLLMDPERTRTHVVTVSATWRGPEDLLGYVHPVDHKFEPTALTQFLINADIAWQKGDKRAQLVLFEEFNLSQPEHWFSDLLALTQFESEKDRVWPIPGQGLRQMPNMHQIQLSPALHFVATVNNDHTTRPLSLRVLDRAAVLHLRLDPRKALGKAGLELDDDQITAIVDIDDALRRRGVSFSIRTALSLSAALSQTEALSLDPWGILDLVLRQDLLGKVRLHARDPLDEDILKDLMRWNEAHSKRLPLCSGLLLDWQDKLATGQDVNQV